MPPRVLPTLLALAVVGLSASVGTRVAAATAAPAAPPSGHAGSTFASTGHLGVPVACAAGSDFVDVVGQGPICEANGQWVVRLRSGREITVAPPDSLSAFAQPPSQAATPARRAQAGTASDAYVCVDPAQHQHISLFYVHFSDRPDNFATDAADIQQQFRDADANYLNYDAAHYFGVSMHLNVECNADGTPKVRDVALSTPFGSSNFGSITSDMQAQGYASTLAHYWIWTDGNPLAGIGLAGQSTVIEDDTPGSANFINTSTAYSINYGYTDGTGGARIFMHENGHAMGAVQISAPDSTGAFHCTDGLDVMCYNDGGPRAGAYSSSVCADAPNGDQIFDCNFNDYWNPAPAPGSYLATHWNLASPNNQWISLQPSSTSTTQTSLSASATGQVAPGTSVVLWASVSAFQRTPAGTVTFLNGSTALGTGPLDAQGRTSLTIRAVVAGTETLTAVYSGEGATFDPSTSNAVQITVAGATGLTTAPAVVDDAAGTRHVFWRAQDGNLWEATAGSSGSTGPSFVGMGPLGSRPAAVVQSSGEVDAFWKGTDANLWEAVRNGAGWSGPFNLGMGPLGSAPTVATWGSELDVFWQGTDRGLWETFQPAGSGWQPPQNLGMGPLGSGPTAAAHSGSGEQDVFWEGTDRQLWEGYWNGTRWVGPQNLGMGPLGSNPTASVQAGGEEDVVWQGTDRNLWIASWNGSGWSGPGNAGMGPLGSTPAIAASTSELDVFWQGTDRGLWTGYRGSSGWQGPFGLGM